MEKANGNGVRLRRYRNQHFQSSIKGEVIRCVDRLGDWGIFEPESSNPNENTCNILSNKVGG